MGTTEKVMKDLKKEIEKILDELILSVPSDEFGTAKDGEECERIFNSTVSKIQTLLAEERKKTLEEVMGLITEEINYSELKLYEGDRQHEGIKATLELIVDKILSKLKSKGE